MATTMLPHLEIVDRFKTQFPVVDSVLGYANSRYVALKNYNDYSKATFNRAEDTFQKVVNTFVPVIGRFEQPIHYADNIAVRGFDSLHEKIDSISRTSEEIKTTTVQTIDNTRQRLNSMKNETIEKVHSVFTVPANIIPLINNIFSVGDYILDYILPPPEGYKVLPPQSYTQLKMTMDEKISDFSVIFRTLMIRMKQFTERVRERFTIYSRAKWFPGLLNSVGTFKGNVENFVNSSPVTEAKKLLGNGHSAKQNVQEKKSIKKAKSKSQKMIANNETVNETSSTHLINGEVSHSDEVPPQQEQ